MYPGTKIAGGVEMTNFFGSGPLPDWKEIKDWLGKDIPWHLVDKWEQMQNDDWLDRMIAKLTAERREERVRPHGALPLKFETVKQAKKLTVSFPLPKNASLNQLRLYAISDRLRIAGLPDGRMQSVRFPCLVYPRSGKASLRGQTLRVEFRRRPADQEEVELFIQP